MKKELNLFEDICRLMTDSTRPEKTLETMVTLVAGRLGIDACSVYLFSEDKADLVLRATFGLTPSSVGKIRMSPRQGLTGLVVEHSEPVFVKNPSEHPRYKHFKDSGEEIYRIFLGLPLVYHQHQLGVLVFQTRDADAISDADLPVFTSIASQIAATVAYTGLLENLEKERIHRESLQKKLQVAASKQAARKGKKSILRGTPVCRGIAEGHAHYFAEGIGFDQVACNLGDDVTSEIRRLDIALSQTRSEIEAIGKQIGQLAPEDAAIFESHAMLVADDHFKKRIVSGIQDGYCAEYALKQAVEKLIAQFLDIENPYLRERAADMEDIGKRVLKNLVGAHHRPMGNFDRDSIVIAADLSAVDLMELLQPKLKGIALSKGGRTSHAAILSKSFEIPLVVGITNILETVKEDDFLILDGTSGLLFRDPPQAIRSEYQRLKAEKEQHHQQLDTLRDQPAITRDGHRVPLDANIGLLSDTDLVRKYGSDAIGLYRTEFPFLTRKRFPSESEQTRLYRNVLENTDGKSVTIRTLDVGGDKFLSYLDYPKEQNPYLGWRSIRVSLELDDIFRTQLRAILRVSVHGPVKLLFPMVSSLAEARRILSIVDEEKKALSASNTPFDPNIPMGIMVEVPATAIILDLFLDHFDFVSIGTNDLIQYTLAVDRNNPKVAALYNPLHPAVIKTISNIIATCNKRGKEISICGEAAANPLCAYLFVTMGADRLSMSPSAIPIIKNLIREMSRTEAHAHLTAVMKMRDEGQICQYLYNIIGPEQSPVPGCSQ